MKGNSPNTFFIQPITTNYTENVILTLKNKACAINSLPLLVLKQLCEITSPELASIINNSSSIGYFPKSLKIARGILIPKNNDVINANNYLPISILPLFSEIFEKVA